MAVSIDNFKQMPKKKNQLSILSADMNQHLSNCRTMTQSKQAILHFKICKNSLVELQQISTRYMTECSNKNTTIYLHHFSFSIFTVQDYMESEKCASTPITKLFNPQVRRRVTVFGGSPSVTVNIQKCKKRWRYMMGIDKSSQHLNSKIVDSWQSVILWYYKGKLPGRTITTT